MSVVTVTILSEGKIIDPRYELLSVDIIREINRIPYASVMLNDGNAAQREFAASNTGFFEPGRKIEIKLRYEGDPASEKTVFQGLVITHTVESGSETSTLKVEMKDAAIKLTQVRKNRIFKDKSDDQIIKEIIEPPSLPPRGLTAGKIAATQPMHAEIVQYGCTDWDFMLSRSESNGLLVKVIDGTISLTAVESGTTAKRTFEYGIDEIYSFEMEANANGQYAEVSSLAWDIKTQKMTQAVQAKNFNLAPGNLDGKKLAGALGGETCTLVNSAPLAPEELQTWADAKMARSRLGLVRGRLALPGRNDVDLLDTIAIKGVGERFNGNTLVTGLRHRVSDQGWITDIQFGLAANWLLERPGAPVGAIPAAGLLPPMAGLHIGIVAGFEQDPNKEFRVKVQMPSVGEKQNTLWARLAAPDAGKARGFYFRPETGDEVVIGFVNEDPRQPVILGALYGSINTPPERFGAPTEKNTGKGMASKKGSVIGFDDELPGVFIETPAKNTLMLNDKDKTLQLSDQHGNKIIMDENGITVASAKDLKLTAKNNVEITGTKVDVK